MSLEIERFYLGCLSHASYLVYDDGEAAVIDPQRDVDRYVAAAKALNVRIRWVIETHLHADFVSGHMELAQRTGATICMGKGSGAGFPHRALADGDVLPLGKGILRCMATPGHTEEGVSIVAAASISSPPLAVFTGDTLFIGDVGRPDLSPTRTPQQLASMLFDSLHDKLMTLPDETVVYPAHGAGSLCGRQMSSDASSTIGHERATNYALQAKDREQFIELITSDLPPKPTYFLDEVALNRSGAMGLHDLPPIPDLTPDETLALQQQGAVLLDVRPVMQFAAAHIPGSIHVALSGQFASWAARVLGVDARIVLIAEDDDGAREARLRLARVGMEQVVGSLGGSVYRWMEDGKPVQALTQIAAIDLSRWFEQGEGKVIVDVRDNAEYATGHIPGSVLIPLAELQARLGEIPTTTSVVVHCQSGYRSSCAASLLLANGFNDVVNLTGGYEAWRLSHPVKPGLV
jgi:glyoxylase-like metal-dependent hydrolase (beta-lactamase superfamily II)/rhodanese-related sulfurtransferase